MEDMMNNTCALAIDAATAAANGTILSNALDSAQKAIVRATTEAMTEGNIKLALAAGAGAALVGTGFLIYEYGGAAADAVSNAAKGAADAVSAACTSAGNAVGEGAAGAVTWIADSVVGIFGRPTVQIITIAEGEPEYGLENAAFA